MCVFASVTTVFHFHLKLNTEIISNVSGHCCCPGLLRSGTFLPLSQLYCLWISGEIHGTRGWLRLTKETKPRGKTQHQLNGEKPMVIE